MEKFTNIKKNEPKTETNEEKFKNDEMSIITFDEKDIITSTDRVVILPYFKDEGFILLKYEKLPAFNFKYKDRSEYNDIDYYITCIKGNFNESESEIQNVRRIVHESCGLVLSNIYNVEVDKLLFKDENNTGQYHICLLPLTFNDYKQSSIKIDENDKNRVIRISLADIDIKTYDLVTEYMLLRLKYDFNLSN
jgi:hypothetical protein